MLYPYEGNCAALQNQIKDCITVFCVLRAVLYKILLNYSEIININIKPF